ncbi:MAG: Ig-like domain-containing protein [Saprospiraceae bacterium]|nr:Ig-like domain-containing protein [Saprospiraceae bacterium]
MCYTNRKCKFNRSSPSSGNWTITRSPGAITYSGTGTSYTVTGLPVNNTYSFTITNVNNCISSASANVTINSVPGTPVLGGPSEVCIGQTANVTPSTNGTWTSSNSSIATVTNSGLVNGLAAGTINLTYTRTSDGCSNSKPFSIYKSYNTVCRNHYTSYLYNPHR